MSTLLINLVLGWAASLLVNYLADVLPATRKLSKSLCPSCGADLGWKYYLFLAPCGHCERKPSLRHLVVVVLGPILGALLHFFPISNLGNYGALLWMAYLGLVVVIDLEHRLILHPVSLVGALLGAFFGIVNHGWGETLLGGAAGFGIMLLLYFLGELFVRLLSRSRGEEIDEVALGFGDVNLAGIMGLLLGWPGVIGGLVLAIILGGVVSGLFMMVQLVRKQYRSFQALPYGPFLVLSLVVIFYLSQIVR
jgi:leader peptidase (prepilin peptidase)/N-methyltransferase